MPWFPAKTSEKVLVQPGVAWSSSLGFRLVFAGGRGVGSFFLCMKPQSNPLPTSTTDQLGRGLSRLGGPLWFLPGSWGFGGLAVQGA